MLSTLLLVSLAPHVHSVRPMSNTAHDSGLCALFMLSNSTFALTIFSSNAVLLNFIEPPSVLFESEHLPATSKARRHHLLRFLFLSFLNASAGVRYLRHSIILRFSLFSKL